MITINEFIDTYENKFNKILKTKINMIRSFNKIFFGLLYNLPYYCNKNDNFKLLSLNYNNFNKLVKIRKNIHIEYRNFCFINSLNNIFKFFIDKYKKKFKNVEFNVTNFFGLINDAKGKIFWNAKIQEISNKIFLPIEENMTLNNNINILQKSWFNYNSYNSTQQNTENIVINKDRKYNNVLKTIKVKMFLNKDQRKDIIYLTDVYRYFYNRTISYINNYDKKTQKTFYIADPEKNKNDKIYIDLKDIKSKFSHYTVRDKLKITDNDKYTKYPSHLKDYAIAEACDNYEKCIKRYFENLKPFNLKYKIFKNDTQTINIEKRVINIKGNKLSLYSNTFKNLKNIKLSQNCNKYVINDSSITYNKMLKEFYLNLVYEDINEIPKLKDERTAKINKILENKKVVSNDAGVRTFATLYEDSKIIEIGNELMTSKINKLFKEVDIIKSILSKKEYFKKDKIYKMTNKRKKNIKKAMFRKNKKIKNLIKELHDKTVNYLVKNYGRIILPTFNVQNMVEKLPNVVNRHLLNLSFYKFKLKVEHKCEEYDIDCIERNEVYTSKTCTKCGRINKELGSSKIYNCKSCRITIKRDHVGARNIMLKNNNW